MSLSAEFLGGGEAAIRQFGLRVRGLADGDLLVERFESEQLALSADYAVQVQALTGVDDLDPEELAGQAAALSLRWEGGERHLHGIVHAASLAGETADGHRLTLTLRSPLAPLADRHGNRVFLGQSVVEIVRRVLGDAGLAGEAVRFEVAEEPPAREFVVQYDESDLAFVERLLAYHGLFYAFVQEARGATLLVTDRNEALTAALGSVALDYQPLSGQTRTATTVYHWEAVGRRTVPGVRLRDYNPDAPERTLDVQHGEGHADYRFGEGYGERREGERLARLRAQAHAWPGRTAVAETDCRAVLPGTALELSGLGAGDGTWLVVAARIDGDQRSARSYGDAAAGPGFRARLTLIPLATPYRTPVPNRRRLHGLFTARIEGDGGEYAYLDDAGRYRIRLAYDLGDRPDAEASHPVRLLRPYGGPDYGLHFPLHHGTEVAVGCLNGNLDRPIIMGALHNAEAPNPVTGSNPSQNLLRTWAGNELLMDDRRHREHIRLATPGAANHLTLDASVDGHAVTLQSEQGDLRLESGRQMSLEAGRDQQVEVGRDHTVTVQGEHTLLTREGDIALESGRDLSLKAAEAMQLEAARADVDVRAGRDLRVASGAGASLEVRRRDARLRVTRGSLQLQTAGAMTFRGEGNAPIRIGQSGASIEITADGRLAIDAAAVEISAGSITIEGQGVGNNS